MRELRALGIAASITGPSRSRALVERTLALLAAEGVRTALLDLNEVPAEALLGRRAKPALDAAFGQVADARIVLLGTPTYRATYSGLLKTFFDLLPREALAGKVVGAVATGAVPMHALMLDHGLRPLVASLGGLSAAGLLYVTDAEYPSGAGADVPEPVLVRLRALASELRRLGEALAPR